MALKAQKIGREEAEALALRAIALIAADEDMLPRFLALTGSGLDDLRDRLADPDFLGATLDFILESGDEWVARLAEAADLAPETILAARRFLPGGQVEWTP